MSRSRWLQKVVVCAPNAYWPNATGWTSRQEEMVWTAQAGKPLASLAEDSDSDGETKSLVLYIAQIIKADPWLELAELNATDAVNQRWL